MERRSFSKLMAAATLAAMFRNGWAGTFLKQEAIQLPDVIMNGNSVEICTNSRYSFHAGYTPVVDNQVIANTLWAAACAPLMATERIIYLSMQDNLYTYKFIDGKHVLEVHAAGDKRSEKTAAFEIGVATDPAGAAEDAGAALHWAQLASVAFWKTKVNQAACCPKDSGRSRANSTWNPVSEIHCVNCYGQSSSVSGLVKTLAAVSSDKTLPDPKTDGTVSLEAAMKSPLFGKDFSSDDLTSEQISQILWASYGCTAHKVSGTSNIALSVASFMGDFYMTGRIYILTTAGVLRYHMRKGTDAKTADHRLESVSTSDFRPQLRTALSRLPQNAPVYIVYCGQAIEYQQLLEAGYCGAGALLQSTALGLQGHYAAQFTDTERSAIQTACGIPVSHKPMLVFSAGKALGTHTEISDSRGMHGQINIKAAPDPFIDNIAFTIDNTGAHSAEIMIYTISGRCIKTLHKSTGNQRIVHWDGTDSYGKTVQPGIYTCKAVVQGKEASVVVRKM